MNRIGMWMMVGALSVAGACGGSKDEKKPDSAPAVAMVARPADDALIASCVKMREQMQLCKEQAIDMMMEERSKVNEEMKTKMADAAQKAALRTEGLTELDADGGGGDATLAARTEKCKEVTTRMPAQIPQPMLDSFNGLSSCWDKPCADRVNCMRPFIAHTLTPPK